MAIKNPFGAAQSPIVGEMPSARSRIARWLSSWPLEKSLGIILALLVLGGLVKLGASYGIVPSVDFPATSGKKWQAVFLVNNQVYFGRLKNYNRGYVRLDDVYYLQITQALQPQAPGQPPQLNLVKLGGELHGPEDRMFIPKDRILFFEDMKADSQVVQAIESTRR